MRRQLLVIFKWTHYCENTEIGTITIETVPASVAHYRNDPYTIPKFECGVYNFIKEYRKVIEEAVKRMATAISLGSPTAIGVNPVALYEVNPVVILGNDGLPAILFSKDQMIGTFDKNGKLRIQKKKDT